jgi:hypothetical protein
MANKYENMPINVEYLRNIQLLIESLSFEDKISSMNFYRRAHNEIQRKCADFDFNSYCAMAATMAPGLEFSKAMEYVDNIIEELRNGIEVSNLTLYGAYGWHNIKQAAQIFSCGADFLSGQKTIHLYNCLVNPRNKQFVPVGSRELRGMRQHYTSPDEQFRISKYEYPWLVRHFQIVGEQLNLLPNEIQSCVNFAVTKTMDLKILTADN